MKIIKSYHLFESDYTSQDFLDLSVRDSVRGSTSLTEGQFDQIRKKYCKSWTKCKTPIYRGQSLRLGLGDYIYTNPTKGQPRKSIEETNTHVELISNLPSWKGWPRYTHSVIGTTSKLNAEGFGTVYEIVPFDGSKMVICPEVDIWTSFGNEIDNWGGDIDFVSQFFQQFEFDTSCWKQSNSKLPGLEYSGTIQEELCKIGNIESWCMKEYKLIPGEIEDFLVKMQSETGVAPHKATGAYCFYYIDRYLFNPIKRGFEVKMYDENFSAPNHRQIYTEGPVLLINWSLV